MATTFPRQHARTHRFSLGAPRALTAAPDGSRVVFLRSRNGTDQAQLLWVRQVSGERPPKAGPGGAARDPETAEPSTTPQVREVGGAQGAGEDREYVAADPAALLTGSAEELSAEERARRERSRETGAGIVGYATDAAVELAAFSLSGRLFTAELRAGTARELPATGPVIDPRPAPDGRSVAYVSRGTLRVVGADGTGGRDVATPESASVSYGLAEFIAAEEMSRTRGFWWSPDSSHLLVARVDDAPVSRWWISDPAHPANEPTPLVYPAAGTANAEVTLRLVDVESGAHTPVEWDREGYPYLARAHWSDAGPPLLLVQSRDQRRQRCLSVDPATGATATLAEEEDPDWLELFAGVPAWTPDGGLLRVQDLDGARRLTVDGEPVSPAALHVRAVLDVGERDVLVSASAAGDEERVAPGEFGVHRVPLPGSVGAASGCAPVLPPADADEPTGPAIRGAVRGGDLLVLSTAALEFPGSRVTVLRQRPDASVERLAAIASYAETPVLRAAPTLLHTGERGIPAAVTLPTGYREEDGPLPVLMDPYGGPHAQHVVAAHNAHLTARWFADQGFAVVAADGRGTPGYSPGWEKAISRDLARVVLDDQVEALSSLAGRFPLDLDRVAIRGWSFGGYLAALAVLRRPDVFHAAVAGAPCVDWRLYDTHYTERYCGTPRDDPDTYASASLVTDEGLSGAAPGPHRPLMLIQGLADDNVVAAHALRLSSALLAAGRPHEVLPLSGVTHMPSREDVAENLLLFQVDFLKRSLGLPRGA
ncbi:S9 family peptidase [Streptomyces sp. AJS327]|uniref:S9 family peptidase n=1 Tax=Streptomyces sp. AJS327 TaxID=2545265 RepID=UPI0015DE6070|nr:prolyl oligopeptidase family serine peptidase [Streptomyces sp. AJS327]MBA0051406.1 S9 family peptidase [Streptomyces sp. AJS327]